MNQPDNEAHLLCAAAISQLQQFLHHECDQLTEDQIRTHLSACDNCLESFDIESTISALIRRCHPEQRASSELRLRVMSLRVTWQE